MRIRAVQQRQVNAPGRKQHPDVGLAELAARQHGVVSRRQLTVLGFSNSAVRHRLRVRRLQHLQSSVFAVGHSCLPRNAHYMAAVLACGPSAVLSHRAAAVLTGLLSASSRRIEVTIPYGGGRRCSGVLVHVTRSLPESDVTLEKGIPVTSWCRTIVDLAAVVRSRELRRALQRSMELRLFDRRPLDAVLARSRGRRGTGVLRKLLAELPDEPPPARLELERRFLDLVTDHCLPPPAVNASVQGYEIDFHWPAHGLIVETDGRATHDTAYQFEEDRRRDLALSLAGWQVIRIGWRQVVDDPGRVAAFLRGRLSAQ